MQLFGNVADGSRVLALTRVASQAHAEPFSRGLFERNRSTVVRPSRRHIPQSPELILDAPDLLDDYYLNLLDWSSSGLAVALGDSVYSWQPETRSHMTIARLLSPNYVTSVAWAGDSKFLAVGTSDAEVQVWDAELAKPVRTMGGHSGRVSSCSWNGPVLTSGGRDGVVVHNDVRMPASRVAALRGAHAGEVCGLKWSPSGGLLATGANDNNLCVWDDRCLGRGGCAWPRPLFRFEQHRAAVKALAWCPWQRGCLASGGGTVDRTIRIWDTNGSGACLSALDTSAQVCSLQWAQHEKELVSCHGFSCNSIVVWHYPTLVKRAEITGHTARVLHMAQSPDGTTVATAAADETLRFWRILSGSEAAKRAAVAAEPVLNTAAIR